MSKTMDLHSKCCPPEGFNDRKGTYDQNDDTLYHLPAHCRARCRNTPSRDDDECRREHRQSYCDGGGDNCNDHEEEEDPYNNRDCMNDQSNGDDDDEEDMRQRDQTKRTPLFSLSPMPPVRRHRTDNSANVHGQPSRHAQRKRLNRHHACNDFIGDASFHRPFNKDEHGGDDDDDDDDDDDSTSTLGEDGIETEKFGTWKKNGAFASLEGLLEEEDGTDKQHLHDVRDRKSSSSIDHQTSGSSSSSSSIHHRDHHGRDSDELQTFEDTRRKFRHAQQQNQQQQQQQSELKQSRSSSLGPTEAAAATFKSNSNITATARHGGDLNILKNTERSVAARDYHDKKFFSNVREDKTNSLLAAERPRQIGEYADSHATERTNRLEIRMENDDDHDELYYQIDEADGAAAEPRRLMYQHILDEGSSSRAFSVDLRQQNLVRNDAVAPDSELAVASRRVQDQDEHHQQHVEEEVCKLIEPSPPDFDFCAYNDDDDGDDDDNGTFSDGSHPSHVHSSDGGKPVVTQLFGTGNATKKRRRSVPLEQQQLNGFEHKRKKDRRISNTTGDREMEHTTQYGGLHFAENKSPNPETLQKLDKSETVEVKAVKSVVGLRPSHWARESSKPSNNNKANSKKPGPSKLPLSRASALAAATRKRTSKQKKLNKSPIPPAKGSTSFQENSENQKEHGGTDWILKNSREKTRAQCEYTNISKESDMKKGGFAVSFAPAFVHRTATKAPKGDTLVDNDQDSAGVHWTAPPMPTADLLSPPSSLGKRRQISNGQWTRRLAALSLPKIHSSMAKNDHAQQLQTYLDGIMLSSKNTEDQPLWVADEKNLNDLFSCVNDLVGTQLLHAAAVLLDTALADIRIFRSTEGSGNRNLESDCLFTRVIAPSGRFVYLVRGNKGEETYLCLLPIPTSANNSIVDQNKHGPIGTSTGRPLPTPRPSANYCTCRSFFDKATKPEPIQITTLNPHAHSGPTASMEATLRHQSPLCKHLLALKLITVLNGCAEAHSIPDETYRSDYIEDVRTATETEFSEFVLDRTLGY